MIRNLAVCSVQFPSSVCCCAYLLAPAYINESLPPSVGPQEMRGGGDGQQSEDGPTGTKPPPPPPKDAPGAAKPKVDAEQWPEEPPEEEPERDEVVRLTCGVGSGRGAVGVWHFPGVSGECGVGLPLRAGLGRGGNRAPRNRAGGGLIAGG